VRIAHELNAFGTELGEKGQRQLLLIGMDLVKEYWELP
jgi:hypothetical protein